MQLKKGKNIEQNYLEQPNMKRVYFPFIALHIMAIIVFWIHSNRFTHAKWRLSHSHIYISIKPSVFIKFRYTTLQLMLKLWMKCSNHTIYCRRHRHGLTVARIHFTFFRFRFVSLLYFDFQLFVWHSFLSLSLRISMIFS